MSSTESFVVSPVWHVDPGHAWLAVPRATIAGLGISSFSFVDGDTAYLEEDCDAGLWLEAYGFDMTNLPTFPDVWHDTFNRGMERVSA